jgi:hypothetical protein
MTATWAERYASVGWRVFPIVPGQKRPVYSGWQKDATTDPKMCRQYWPDGLNRNIAVVCGETFDAWDIEVQHLPAFTDYMQTNGYVLPESPIANTGRGGMHILTEPTGVDGTRYLYLNGTHIGELKSTGGFILLCPSVTTGQYSWKWTPSRMTVQPAPAWLLGLLERPKGAVRKFPTTVHSVDEGIRRLEALAVAVATCGEGSRNNYLYWAMRRALDEGIPPRFAADALRAAATKAGLTDHETKQTLQSAYDVEGSR